MFIFRDTTSEVLELLKGLKKEASDKELFDKIIIASDKIKFFQK